MGQSLDRKRRDGKVRDWGGLTQINAMTGGSRLAIRDCFDVGHRYESFEQVYQRREVEGKQAAGGAGEGLAGWVERPEREDERSQRPPNPSDPAQAHPITHRCGPSRASFWQGRESRVL